MPVPQVHLVAMAVHGREQRAGMAQAAQASTGITCWQERGVSELQGSQGCPSVPRDGWTPVLATWGRPSLQGCHPEPRGSCPPPPSRTFGSPCGVSTGRWAGLPAHRSCSAGRTLGGAGPPYPELETPQTPGCQRSRGALRLQGWSEPSAGHHGSPDSQGPPPLLHPLLLGGAARSAPLGPVSRHGRSPGPR